MYDRLNGSTTMIISSSGTTVPGSPTRPEYLKASVYLPPAFIAHHPDLHHPVMDIVQQYIETVGVRTVTMWTQRAHRDLHYSLNQPGNPHPNAHFNAIPNPEHNSAHYTFLGQPYRITDDPSAAHVQAPSPVSSNVSYEFGEDPDASMLAIINLQQLNMELQDQINTMQQQIDDLEERARVADLHNTSLSSSCERAHEQIMFLEGQLQRFAVDRTTSTPVRHIHTTPQSTPLRYNRRLHLMSSPPDLKPLLACATVLHKRWTLLPGAMFNHLQAHLLFLAASNLLEIFLPLAPLRLPCQLLAPPKNRRSWMGVMPMGQPLDVGHFYCIT